MMIARSEILIKMQVEIADFDRENSDLLHLRILSMTDSLIYYSLTYIINCCSNNMIFASMFDLIKSENIENLDTTI